MSRNELVRLDGISNHQLKYGGLELPGGETDIAWGHIQSDTGHISACFAHVG